MSRKEIIGLYHMTHTPNSEYVSKGVCGRGGCKFMFTTTLFATIK
jgi:hypothetical protein